MKKKIALVVSAVVLTALIAAGGTIAYFTTSATAENVITMGNVNIKIVQQETHSNSLTTTPGSKYEKAVCVKNTGENTAYIRVTIEKTWVGNEPHHRPEFIEIEVDPQSGWSMGNDGYYYYQTAVKAGETTKNILDNFRLSTMVDNSYSGVAGKILLTAHAIQADNFTPVTNSSGKIVSWGNIGRFM